MTVWGLGPFDDDETIDFSYELRRSGLTALERACRDARYSDSREEQHAEGFAAASVVAGILSQDSESFGPKTLALKPSKELVDSAAATVRVILENGTLYLDRWRGLGDEVHSQKIEQLDGLLRVLTSDASRHTRVGDVLDGEAPGEQPIADSSWNHMRFSNVQLLSIRTSMKDDVEIERDVDHTFACSSEKVALSVVDTLNALDKDFAIDGPIFEAGENGESDCWLVVATTSYAPNFANTWGCSLLMFDVAYETGAHYDGWGAPIVKRKRSWFGR